MIGRVIGNYKIQSKLGEGGMGAVYKGVDTMLDREVAIKALRPELASQNSVVERFRSEAVTLAKLHHPNIATLYSLFRQTDELYMVLEYVSGETLDAILQRRGALSADEVIPVFCQILDGINHAHELGIIHRDIKPANMMLTEKGTLKVLDFGIARLLGTNRMTRAGNIIGTLEYMPPEQVKGLETDARSDIYSLGMMLYEILTGRLPFQTVNEFELMKFQIEATPAAPRELNLSIPEDVEEAIMRAIRKIPDERFQNAGEFRESLLDAGFAAQGKMRRSTAPRQSEANVNTAALQHSISKPEESEGQVTASENIIKETRLGGQMNSSPAEFEETRLGEAATAGSDSAAAAFGFASANNKPASSSFFDNLTWIHYAGAAGGVLAACVMLFVVSLFIFGGETEKKITDAKPSPAPSFEPKPQKTDSEIKPSAPVMVSQPLAAENPTPLIVEPIIPADTSTETPKDNNGSGKKVDRSGEKAKVAQTTKTPRPTPARTPVNDVKRQGTKTKAQTRCELTGDC